MNALKRRSNSLDNFIANLHFLNTVEYFLPQMLFLVRLIIFASSSLVQFLRSQEDSNHATMRIEEACSERARFN